MIPGTEMLEELSQLSNLDTPAIQCKMSQGLKPVEVSSV